ncbi:SDR family NAD(P)-dependent oxidoreductase [Haliangium sp.]|uniref:SDR family NAD(P)-dependent oxidoreductase n=1 Tax=Haliangium sp. TaxID=2663208 RepID=UPI003D112E29
MTRALPARVLIIGSSDGIGLALVEALTAAGSEVIGLSRSPAPDTLLHAGRDRDQPGYRHVVADVCADDYRDQLAAACDALGEIDACVYCAGIGEPFDPDRIEHEAATFATNLMGLVTTIEVVLPRMLARGRGHIVGLSSLADRFPDPGAPAYGASKAGMSAYLERLALTVRARGVHISNVRFGFVATKMAKSDIRPFEISPERAAQILVRCLTRRPIRLSYPLRMAALLWLVAWPSRVRVWLGSVVK